MLASLLEKDELDLEESLVNTRLAETALQAANPHEDWSDRPPQSRRDDTLNGLHPILGHLNIR